MWHSRCPHGQKAGQAVLAQVIHLRKVRARLVKMRVNKYNRIAPYTSVLTDLCNKRRIEFSPDRGLLGVAFGVGNLNLPDYEAHLTIGAINPRGKQHGTSFRFAA